MAELELQVPDWLRQRADLTPRRVALAFERHECTFAELDAIVDGACVWLLARGIGRGARVGVFAQNSAAYAVAVYALMRIGAVLVPLNTRLTPGEIEWQTRDAEVMLTLRDAELEELVSAHATQQDARRAFAMDEWHSIVYTSGTTGQPKGAILTYGNYWWSAVASALNLGLLPQDKWLACLPLFHVGGLSILLRAVIYGMTTLIHARFDAAAINLAIDHEGVTIVSVVATMLERMLTERADRPFPDTLRCVLLGGGPAPLPLLERAIRCGAPVVQTYGLTETASQIATLAPEDALTKIGSAGKPLLGSELRLEDGEILVRGPSISPGYLHQPPRDGWLRTGDLGYLDEEGYLYVLDRREDLIVSGGENVYPAEVEATLLAHPAVAEAGVIGLPDPHWGRRVAAAVVLRPSASVSAEELVDFCRQRLAGFKVPRLIQFRDRLPRTAAGKLLRRELRIER